MTQHMQGPVVQGQPQAQQQDPLVRLRTDLAANIQRMRKVKNPSPEQVMGELVGTVCSFLEELAENVHVVRDAVVQTQAWASASLGDVDARIGDLESEAGGLDPDLVDKIIRICGESAALFQAILDSAKDPAVAQALLESAKNEEGRQRLSAHIAACAEIVDGLADEEEEDGPPDDEGDSGEGGDVQA